MQGDICECLLIKVINKILNKNNKRVLLNERALNLEKFNAFKVETLKGNVKRHFNVGGYHHMNGGGEGSPPMRRPWREGAPPPPIKGHPFPPSSSHLLVKDISPPLELFPHGLGLARYMFPVAIRQERVVLPLHRWSEEAEVDRCLERVCEHGCAADLRR